MQSLSSLDFGDIILNNFWFGFSGVLAVLQSIRVKLLESNRVLLPLKMFIPRQRTTGPKSLMLKFFCSSLFSQFLRDTWRYPVDLVRNLGVYTLITSQLLETQFGTYVFQFWIPAATSLFQAIQSFL